MKNEHELCPRENKATPVSFHKLNSHIWQILVLAVPCRGPIRLPPLSAASHPRRYSNLLLFQVLYISHSSELNELVIERKVVENSFRGGRVINSANGRAICQVNAGAHIERRRGTGFNRRIHEDRWRRGGGCQ